MAMRKLFIVIVGMVFAFALAINASAKASTSMSKSMDKFSSNSIEKAVNTTDYQKVVDSLNCVSRQLNKANSELQKIKTEKEKLEKELKSTKSEIPRNAKIKRNLIIVIVIIGVLFVAAIILLYLLNKQLEEKEYEIEYDKKKIKELENNEKLLSDECNSNSNLKSRLEKLEKENTKLKEQCYKLQQNIVGSHDKGQVITEENKNVIEHDDSNNNPNIYKQKQRFYLYSDAIVDSSLNKVKERPNDDTIFELILNDQDSTSAKVVIYSGAKRRIIANASFLEGCEKQIIGSNDVVVEREGTAEKDSTTGVWNLIKCPKVIIK